MTEAERAVIEAAIRCYDTEGPDQLAAAELATAILRLKRERTPRDPRDEVVEIARELVKDWNSPTADRLRAIIARIDGGMS